MLAQTLADLSSLLPRLPQWAQEPTPTKSQSFDSNLLCSDNKHDEHAPGGCDGMAKDALWKVYKEETKGMTQMRDYYRQRAKLTKQHADRSEAALAKFKTALGSGRESLYSAQLMFHLQTIESLRAQAKDYSEMGEGIDKELRVRRKAGKEVGDC